MKRITYIFLAISILSSIKAQNNTWNLKYNVPNISDLSNLNYFGRINGNDSPITAAEYIAVDTMSNTFGPASNEINPLAFDPFSNTAVLVNRGNVYTYAQSSGELWWNVSTDLGRNWVRSLTSVQNNFTFQIVARYPSMTIFNPDRSTNIEDLWGCFSWPEVDMNAGNFGWIGYGFTMGLQSAQFAQVYIDSTSFGGVVPTFADEEYIYWSANHRDNVGITLFRTRDYSLIERIDPPNWDSTHFGGSITLGGLAYNGIIYYGITGLFPESIGSSGWEVGYSKSTDHGITWSDWFIVDWKQISVTANYDELWDWLKGDLSLSYAGDIQVDKYGNVHILCGLTDTTAGTEFGYNCVVEFYEITEGFWEAKILAEGVIVHDKSIYIGPLSVGGVNQDPAVGNCGPSFQLATNLDRDFFVAQWTIGSPETADTLCDIFLQSRGLNESNWTSMLNLTETNSMNEDGAHLAPYLAESIKGDSVDTYAFSMFWYEAGNIGPFIEPLNPCVIYIAPVLVKSELIPVELLSFSSSVSNNTVTLNWRTATELNNLGFEIERILNDNWITIGFVKGNGTTTKISSYEFVDELSELYYEGILYYRLKQIDYVGTFEYSNVIEVEFSKNPTSFSVLQNYPNPFNPSTKIKFTIPQSPLLGGDGRGGLVTLKVYDVLGKEVATLVNEELAPGEYEVEFNANSHSGKVRNLPSGRQGLTSGIYFYQLRAGDFIQTKKMVLLK